MPRSRAASAGTAIRSPASRTTRSTAIAGDPSDPGLGQFWAVFVNGSTLSVGGCQHILSAGDEVLWSLRRVQQGRRAEAQRRRHDPAGGADYGPRSEHGLGRAGCWDPGRQRHDQRPGRRADQLPGPRDLQAEGRPGRLRALDARSRSVSTPRPPSRVRRATRRPRRSASTPPRSRARSARFSQIHLSWQGDDGPDGSGISRYRLESRRLDKPGSPFASVVTDTPATAREITATPGAAYEFRVVAFDRASRASNPVTATSLVPLDNLSNRVKFSKRGWKNAEAAGRLRAVRCRGRPSPGRAPSSTSPAPGRRS